MEKGKEQVQRMSQAEIHGTTILSLRHNGIVVVAGDGQVTQGSTILKSNAIKVRTLGNGNVLAGFAGATADAFTLFERLESMLEKYPRQLTRACVELAKAWRTDKYLRQLQAMMAVADSEVSLILNGTGDVVEPSAGVIGIGSGGVYAYAAAMALLKSPNNNQLSAIDIAKLSMDIAADICIYTNRNVTLKSMSIGQEINN